MDRVKKVKDNYYPHTVASDSVNLFIPTRPNFYEYNDEYDRIHHARGTSVSRRVVVREDSVARHIYRSTDPDLNYDDND